MLVMVSVLAGLLMLFVFVQTPKQETLGDAFSGEKKHVTRVERFLVRGTYLLAGLLAGVLFFGSHVFSGWLG